MAEDGYSILVERVANVVTALNEFKAEVRENNKNIIANASADRERWATILKENTKEIMSTINAASEREAANMEKRLSQYEKKISELEGKETSTRDMVLKLMYGLLAIIGFLSVLHMLFGIGKNIDFKTTMPPQPPPASKSSVDIPKMFDSDSQFKD